MAKQDIFRVENLYSGKIWKINTYQEPLFLGADGYYNAVGDPRAGAINQIGGTRAGTIDGTADDPKWKPYWDKLKKLNDELKYATDKLTRARYDKDQSYQKMNYPTDPDEIKRKNKNPDEFRNRWKGIIRAQELDIEKWIKNVQSALIKIYDLNKEWGKLEPNAVAPITPQQAVDQSRSNYVQGSENDPTVILAKKQEEENNARLAEAGTGASAPSNIKKVVIISALAIVLAGAIYMVVKKVNN